MISALSNGTLDVPSSARRAVRCPYGCEYSACAGDYFMARPSTPFTCDCMGEPEPCSLVERAYVTGTDAQGRTFTAIGWVVVKEYATVGDLR